MQARLDPNEYILTLLKENNGAYNLYRTDGRQFKNESERLSTIQFLVDNALITKVPGAVGQTFRLTEKGEKYLYNLYFRKTLKYLATNKDNFKQVSDILKELSIHDPEDELANAIDTKLRQENLVFATEDTGVMINENGKYLLSEQRFGLTQQSEKTLFTNSGIFIQGATISNSPFSNFSNNLPTQASNAPIKSDRVDTWWRRMLSNNWTVTIVGGIIVGLIVAYFVFFFRWNK